MVELKGRKILAIDPGTDESAFVVFDGKRPIEFGKLKNSELLLRLRLGEFSGLSMFIEMIASYGMPVGREVFATCVWIGVFREAHRGAVFDVFRKDVKLHLCYSLRAKDANVRAAILDRYGGKAAIGSKKSPGALYGVSGDVWSALAIAITAWETLIQIGK